MLYSLNAHPQGPIASKTRTGYIIKVMPVSFFMATTNGQCNSTGFGNLLNAMVDHSKMCKPCFQILYWRPFYDEVYGKEIFFPQRYSQGIEGGFRKGINLRRNG